MINRSSDPRTEDSIVYELQRTQRGAAEPETIGRATFRGGKASVDAPDDVAIAVTELLGRAFVDRVESDERPRGYRRTGQGMVDMLVPGMAEHFIARMRGLWLSYPDGSVVTAREAASGAPGAGTAVSVLPDLSEAGPPVTDPQIRRATLGSADHVLGKGPLVRTHTPESGLRTAAAPSSEYLRRTDCGWLV